MPVAGEIVAFNENLEDNPDLVNTDPYGDGWMVKVIPTNANQLDALLSSNDYKALLDA